METWVHSSQYQSVPPFAVVGGIDCDSTPIYVGRSFHEGNNLPAKVIPSKGCSYVGWDGKEIRKTHYEVLVGQGYAWVSCSGGSVPTNAVSSGTTCDGEALYIGRAHYANSLTVGKIHPSYGCLFIPFGGKEVRFDSYEVLIRKAVDHWMPTTPNHKLPNAAVGDYDSKEELPPAKFVPNKETWVHSSQYQSVPPFAVVGGRDNDGTPIYVGRSFHEGDILAAKVIPSKGCGYVCWDGKEIRKTHYEVLVGQGYAWVSCYGGSVPPNAVRSGTTRNGEALYIGRGHYANSLTVGKIHPSHGCLYIPFGGKEVRLDSYEVLIRQATDQWKPTTLHHVPPNAVVGGYDSDRTPIYVGRAMHEGELLPAKFVPNKGGAFVCCGGYEISKFSFDVLCGHGYSWVHVYNHDIPPSAVISGVGRNGNRLYVGRGHYQGSLTPGLVSQLQRCLFIPYGGREIRIDSYEILCRS